MIINKEVNERFESFLFDWDYKTYLLLGGFGGSKSWHIVFKLILMCLEEKRKVMVVRDVYETIRESCYDLFEEILESMNLLAPEGTRKHKTKVIGRTSPMSFTFPNGSKIIFKGLDKPKKLKSINNVSIIWIEEAAEISYDAYKELVGRLRHPTDSLHMILSWNPVDEENWTYKHFFIDRERDVVHMRPEILYKRRTVVKGRNYYHHSVAEDNVFLQKSYLDELKQLKEYDPDLYRVAWLGQYGVTGKKVLPQVTRLEHTDVMRLVARVHEDSKYNGLDFGFETSYNALVRCAVDEDMRILYVYKEHYKNHVIDAEFAPDIAYLKEDLITADSEDPKAIRYYNMSGFYMGGCKKFKYSVYAGTKKMKGFKSIVVSSECPNTWRELNNLAYKVDANGKVYNQKENITFNIDAHTFDALRYALDLYEGVDLKEAKQSTGW